MRELVPLARERGKVRELAVTAGRDQGAELGVVVGEEQERRRGRPFLTHEEQRRHRQEEQQRRGQAVGVDFRVVAEPGAERAVADLVVILDAVDERLGGQRVGGAAARSPGAGVGCPSYSQPRSITRASPATPGS